MREQFHRGVDADVGVGQFGGKGVTQPVDQGVRVPRSASNAANHCGPGSTLSACSVRWGMPPSTRKPLQGRVFTVTQARGEKRRSDDIGRPGAGGGTLTKHQVQVDMAALDQDDRQDLMSIATGKDD